MAGPFAPSVSASGIAQKVYWPAMQLNVKHCFHVGCLQHVFTCTQGAPHLNIQVMAGVTTHFSIIVHCEAIDAYTHQMQHSPTRGQDADYLSQPHNRNVPALEPSKKILLLLGDKDLCIEGPFSPGLVADRSYGLSGAWVAARPCL